MARFSYQDADLYGGSSSTNGINYFSLKDDGDKAYVHLLGDDMNDFPGYAVHQVQIGDKKKYVNCLREAGAPITDCPFCAKGKNNPELSKVWAKLFIPLYDCDKDEVKIWERGKQFFGELASFCSHNPNASTIVTEVERRGKKGSTDTTYRLYATNENDNFKLENVADEIPEILGDVVLDKTKEEMEQFLNTGRFETQSDAGVMRRGSRSDLPFTEGNERRTPNRTRRSAEDEY